MKEKVVSPAVEPMPHAHHHHLVCWKSVFGGLLVSIMGYMILASLGAGIAGLRAESLIQHEEGGSALATGAGLWLGLSAVIALFCGSYFALRVSRFMTNKVGAAHGFVIASLFFILLVSGVGGMMGGIARGLGSFAADAGGSAVSLSQNPGMEDTVNKAIGTSSLKSPPKDVAQGIAVRLMQGDLTSAKDYFAYQSGLPPAEVDAKVTQLKTDLENAAKIAGEKTARAVADAGWSLFVTFLVGLIAAVMGGRVGAHANVSRPFASGTAEERHVPAFGARI